MTGIIAHNLKALKLRIDRTAAAVGRAGQVRLLAVSKRHPLSAIQAAYKAGQRLFGENYGQELRDKVRECDLPLEWHYIGPLQRNKLKYIVGSATLIHTVASREIGLEIQKRAAAQGLVQEILVQVKTSDEPSKHGIDPGRTAALVAELNTLPNLSVKGLMTMPPFTEDPEGARPYFRTLVALAHSLPWKLPEGQEPELSMGMSSDFQVAIEEGSTLIRVGTAIFGQRPLRL